MRATTYSLNDEIIYTLSFARLTAVLTRVLVLDRDIRERGYFIPSILASNWYDENAEKVHLLFCYVYFWII